MATSDGSTLILPPQAEESIDNSASPLSARIRSSRKSQGSGAHDNFPSDQIIEGPVNGGLSAAGSRPQHLVTEWPATALSGNDIMSSCLYTIGLVTQSSGKVAPIAFLLVSMILYLIRSIYAMAVLSFPHNGGSYNLLINVAPKPVAALGACLSIISYIATAVVSAVSSCDYLGRVVNLDHVMGSVACVLFFAILVLMGLKESSTIAFAIFIVHITTLCLLGIGSLALASSEGFSLLMLNIHEPYPVVHVAGREVGSNLAMAIFLGSSTAMLGVSGYETSAQFVEQMAPGVFVKTLRNLWVAVTIINTFLSFIAISILPIADITAESDTVLSKMAFVLGEWVFGKGSHMSKLMADWMSIDAFIVLSGAVLTAFVGIDGLCHQMALDGVLPMILLRKNSWRGTHHYIILSFSVLCVILIVVMEGKVSELAGIYSLAFLGVLATFTVGCMLLKVDPKHAIPIATRGLMLSWWHLALALALIVVSLVGNFLSSSGVLLSFFSYLAPMYLVCLFCLYSERNASCLVNMSRKVIGISSFNASYGSGTVGTPHHSPAKSQAQTALAMYPIERLETSPISISSAGSSPTSSPARQASRMESNR